MQDISRPGLGGGYGIIYTKEERSGGRMICNCYLKVGTKCSLREDGRLICPYCHLPIRNQLDMEKT